MSDPYVALNGAIVAADTAALAVTDRGFLYGDGIFETIRITEGVPFRLNAHVNRLIDSAHLLRFPPTLTAHGIEGTIQALLNANDRRDGTLRITVSRGSSQTGLDPNSHDQDNGTVPSMLITTAGRRATLADGCRMVSVAARRDEQAAISRVKSTSYLPNILARFEVKDVGADEGLLLNTSGAVAECTVSNVFWVRGQVVYTPSVECGILPGITRAAVLELARRDSILVAEGAFDARSLFEADAVFLTNSLIGLAAVSSVDDRTFASTENPVLEQLRTAYHELVANETSP